MSNITPAFETRLDRIDHRRATLSRGYISTVGPDGLIIFRPRRSPYGAAWKGLVLIVFGFFVFKALILAQLGGGTYAARVADLHQGSHVERVSAWVMHVDPLTTALSAQIRPFFW